MLESAEAARLAAARAGDQHAFRELIEPHQRELLVHGYRLLGSLHDAEDAVQQALLRAWRLLDSYEGRASFRAWLYKITTNVCFSMIAKRPRRALPAQTHPPADPYQPYVPPLAETIWLEPFPDQWLDEVALNPEARYTAYESVTLAFQVALQTLPPRQRAVLILRDVLNWRAREAAELLELTVPAVNSALHRARTTLAQRYHLGGSDTIKAPPVEERARALLDRYIQAWEAADVPTLVALLKEDATVTMPPSPSWYDGQAAVSTFTVSTFFTGAARGRWRMLRTRANSQPAVGVYQYDPAHGVHRAYGIQVLLFDGERLANATCFVQPELFPYFGLPQEL